MKFIIILGVIIFVLHVLLLYGVWRAAFSTKDNRYYEPMGFPKGKQYKKVMPEMKALVEKELEVPFEEVYITSFDGLKLYGRIYKGDPGRPVQLLFHGWKSNALRDFAGGSAILRQERDTVILVDERGINKSEGDFLSYGILERKDILSWIQYADKRWNHPLMMLYGVSMGAAAVLMALDQNLPKNVVGVVADSPYSSPKDIICTVVERKHLPVRPAWYLIRQAARLYGHFDIDESTAVQAVSQSDVPVLLLHGDDDRFVPVDMSEDICAAAKGKAVREVFPGAAHGISYLQDVKRYTETVEKFVELCTENYSDGSENHN